jgi:hypothetical protein
MNIGLKTPKSLAIYILVGAACGTIMGIIVGALGIWIGLGAGVGLLIGAILLQKRSVESGDIAGIGEIYPAG